MKEFLPNKLAKRQYILHLLVLILLVMAVLSPELFSRPLGLALCASSLLLEFNLIQAVVRYRKIDSEISEQSKTNQEIVAMDTGAIRGKNGESA